MKSFTIITAITLSFMLSAPAFCREKAPEIEPLEFIDEGYLNRHRSFVDNLGRSEFGTRIRKNKSDLQLLKRILDNGIIKQTEKSKFHSLGVVLGDIYVNELNMEWRNYSDEYGKSHAVCIPKSEHCLFPVTMISKRGTLGVIPDVIRIYQRGVELIEDDLPKLPYAVKEQPTYTKPIRTYPLK
jgi:hypothetical protein